MSLFQGRKAGVLKKVVSLLLLLSLLAPNGFYFSRTSIAASVPVNPFASAEAKTVLQKLYQITGKKMISGQHDYLESPDEWNNKLNTLTGKYAALHGYELGAILNQSDADIAMQRQNVVNSAIAWYKAGGIVTITDHASIPGTCQCWSNVQTSMNQTDFNKYVTPGTAEYNKLIADIDKVAVYLGELRDAGVPVLWRPYHEMNGGWFWWGKKSNFTALWNIMYDRYVNVHKLNNLLWVWSPNAPNANADPFNATYPGSDKVDVLAVDIYNNDYNPDYYNKIVQLAAGKLVAVGENGELPSSTVIDNQPNWAFMMTWGKMLTDNNTITTIQSFYSNPKLITRDSFALAVQETSPATVSIASASAQNGLKGEYFDNKDLTSLMEVRTDSNINFNWHNLAPVSSVQPDTFSVRWTGKLKPKYSETYTISSVSDDGIRVWVNGVLVIDSWFNQSWMERKGTISLTAGVPVDFKVEFYDDLNGAAAQVSWASLSQAKEVIPASALFLP